MPDSAPVRDARRPATGVWIVAGMLILGAALAVFAIWYQWGQTRRCLAFYGSEAAHRIQVAPRVELWRLDKVDGASRQEPVRRTDISRARGLVHLRRGLVEDANFAWDGSPSRDRPPAPVALAFFDRSDEADPDTLVIVRVDDRGGWLEVEGRPGTLVLGRIAAGLRKWLADIESPRP